MKVLQVQKEQQVAHHRAFPAVSLHYCLVASLVNFRIAVVCPKELLAVQGKLLWVRIGVVSKKHF